MFAMKLMINMLGLALAVWTPFSLHAQSNAFAQQAKFTSSTLVNAGTEFGTAVAVSGDTAVVGAPQIVGTTRVAHVYVRSGTTWAFQATLFPIPVGFSSFGASVAISGDTIVVSDQSENVGRGSVWVYTRAGGTWTRIAKLVASDAANNDNFGSAVAIDGNTIAVGSRQDTVVGGGAVAGSTYVYTGGGANWTLQARINSTPLISFAGFGSALSLKGDSLLVGAPQTNQSQGSAYLFTRNNAVWTLTNTFVAADAQANNSFGASVSLLSDTAIIGAPDAPIGANPSQGAAYVYTGGGASWTQLTKLTASDGIADDSFGASVSLGADQLVIGAPVDVNNGQVGQAYTFQRNTGGWSQSQIFNGAGAQDNFGSSVALAGNTIVIGAKSEQPPQPDATRGAAYIYASASDLFFRTGFEN
jgi:hypothetical protein